MWSTAREVAAGDVVIVWMTRELVQPLLITPGKELNNRFGNYRHSDLIGLPFGSKVASRTTRGYIHILRPTPELWTMALPHRTQILYLADIAFITSWLDIKPGSRVIEAGTGSGSFSHSVVRTIGSTGHLWSYEFHETRANKAREEFAQHGMSEIVTLTHRNVCKEGFTLVDSADSVFLDLPAPWDAVEHAKKALRKDRVTRICCFSPCMEQVLRTVSALNHVGFTEITMYEILLRPQDVSQISPLPHVSEIADSLKLSELRREEKRQKQIASSRLKRKREEETPDEVPQTAYDAGYKRARADDETDVDVVSSSLAENAGPAYSIVREPSEEAVSSLPTSKIIVSKTINEVRGHTSYLTFACLLPSLSQDEPASRSDDISTMESY